MMIDSNPPLLNHLGSLLRHPTDRIKQDDQTGFADCQLPLIDLAGLSSRNPNEKATCAAAICRASAEWGFFQVINHGISAEILENMRRQQEQLFRLPFEDKVNGGLLNNSYRWGTPTATSPNQFSWSEAFHIPLTKISDKACYGEFISLREVMTEVAGAMSKLARVLGRILAENLSKEKVGLIDEICDESTCFLRLNHYPVCQIAPDSDVFGLVPHTDSDFLTILYQDHVGGLQLLKDSKWVSVNPIQDALIVNVGDLFQAWSNDVYKSVQHKVMANGKKKRYSIAYFLCPSFDSLIGSCGSEPRVYRNFTFGEYRNQVQQDVRDTGHKVGLPRFFL